MPHPHYGASHAGWSRSQPELSVKHYGLSEILQHAALTRGFTYILSENQMDGLHFGGEKKAVALSELQSI